VTVRTLLLLLGVLGCSTGFAQVDRAAFVSLAASVLKIEVQRAQGGIALGSGVMIEADTVVTNCHVTRDARQINVLRGGERWLVEAQAVDVAHDVCLLQVPGLKANVVQRAPAAQLKVGQSVTAIGFTGGAEMQHSAGTVVALHRLDGGTVIQSSNWFSSGASGGGLFDDELRLVGILTFRLRGGEAHYFAAPTEWLQPMLQRRDAFRPVEPIDPQQLAFWQRPPGQQPNFLKTTLLQREQRWNELETAAEEWARADASDAEPQLLLGMALEGQHRLAAARQALEKALQLDAKSDSAWYRLGLLLLRQGQRERAIEVRARLVELGSSLADALAREIDKT
jgi:serine protease Do